MDSIPDVDEVAGPDAAPAAAAPAPSPVDALQPAAPVEDPAGATAPERTPEAGTLAQTESLLGAVIAGEPDGEAAALRRTLELDDRPPTATPTVDEQVEQAAALRRAVTAEAPVGPAGVADPTEPFEVHDAARAGDPIAQAIDETAEAQRAAQAQAARAEQRDDAVLRQEHVPAATDRATQDAGAAATTQAGAGRPPAERAPTDAEREAEEERVERIDGLDATQRVRPVGPSDADA